jgi:hypothetical protein
MEEKNPLVEKLIELTNKKVKNIYKELGSTIIEFENGEKIPLMGEMSIINSIDKIKSCSFCGTEQTDKNLLLSPDEKEEPLICFKCIKSGMDIFISKGFKF